MTKTYQARYFSGEQLDEHMHKVLSKDIAGRGLEIDQNGIMHSTVPGYATLRYSYVHEGNKEVYATDVDIAAGVFTAPGHGFAENDTVVVTVDPPYNLAMPYSIMTGGLLLAANYNSNVDSAQQYYVKVMDEDHFQLSLTSGGNPISLRTVSTMDLTKFHFEQVPIDMELEISELNSKECLVVVTGKIFNSFRYASPTNKIMYGINGGNRTGGIAYDTVFGADTWGSCKLGVIGYNYMYATLEYKVLDHQQLCQVNNIDYIVYTEGDLPQYRHNRQYYHLNLTSDVIEGIKLYGDYHGGFFNGTKVEVYTR